MAVIRAIRGFFDGQGFDEIDTPALQVSPGLEPHLQAFRTEILSPDRQARQTLYLHTSPEFAMKKLLVAGMERIYQICHVYRNAEGSRLHSPEFTMLEWYRARADYRQIMEDSIGLLRHCARAAGIQEFKNGSCAANPFLDWEIITVCEAFEIYAGFDLERHLPDDVDGFSLAVQALGLHTAPGDSWDDLFFRVFLDRIEPRLGQGRPTIIHDYPVSMAALSRPKAGDPRFAERFEIYVCGIELANAFGELTDPQEQKRRFEEDMDLKEKLYGERYPVDPDFMAALEHGMPESSGIALGVDRLAMLCTGAQDIRDILWQPLDQAVL